MRSLFLHSIVLSACVALATSTLVYAADKDGRAGSWRKGTQGAPDLKAAQAKVDQNPKDAGALNDLGFALRQNGKNAEAEKYLKQAVEIKPEMGEAHANLSVNYFDMKKYSDALAEAEKAVKIDKDNAIFRVVLGNAKSKSGDLKGAAQEYKIAVQLKPDYENALYNLGRVQNENGDVSDAKLTLAKALELDPNDERVLALLDKLEKGDTTLPAEAKNAAAKESPDSKKSGKSAASK